MRCDVMIFDDTQLYKTNSSETIGDKKTKYEIRLD